MNSPYFSAIFCWLNLAVVQVQLPPCTTPNGEKATCVSLLTSCPILLTAASQDAVAKKFVEASACPGGNFMVCCGTSGNFTQSLNKSKDVEKPSNESNREYVIRKLLPSKKYCGMQHTDDYFYNETETSVDEFPWLVYFAIPEDYVNKYYLKKESNCVGVLISNLYILTSYYDCYLSTRRLGKNNTIEMIFGQHHIYKDVSCIPTQYGIDDCTLPILREVSYVRYTSPSSYDHSLSRFHVALLRLAKKIDYSDFVRPICLPLDENDIPKAGDTVVTSGWGEEQSVDGKSVKLKKRIKHTVMDNEECEQGNSVLNPICGTPLENNTHYVCPGDNGGPLMYQQNNNWIVTGIVSGTVACDDVHPVIAEQLTQDTLDWIFDSIVMFENTAAKDDHRL